MRLTTWNCKGAFSRKHSSVAALKPDVLVAPEAEKLTAVQNVIGGLPLRSHYWVGDNKKKGLAVLSYGNYSLRGHEAYEAGEFNLAAPPRRARWARKCVCHLKFALIFRA
jgi:hypothetical protein